jgi:hypothetical protein
MALLTLGSVCARADLYLFSLTGSGSNTISFVLPTNPTPDGGAPDDLFVLNGVSIHDRGTDKTANLAFFNSATGGGLAITDSTTLDLLISATGDQLYTGPESNPMFRLGGFTLDEFETGAFDGPYNLTITAVPEPGSLILLGSGGLALFPRLRRK